MATLGRIQGFREGGLNDRMMKAIPCRTCWGSGEILTCRIFKIEVIGIPGILKSISVL